MKRFAVIFILLLAAVSASAQTDSSGFFVQSFKKLEWDLDARSNYPELDQNNRKAALIKVVIPEAGFDFDVGVDLVKAFLVGLELVGFQRGIDQQLGLLGRSSGGEGAKASQHKGFGNRGQAHENSFRQKVAMLYVLSDRGVTGRTSTSCHNHAKTI